MPSGLTDKGRPLGTGLQEQGSNHLRRLQPKAMVANAEGKGLAKTRSGDRQEEAREPPVKRRTLKTMSKPREGELVTAGLALDETWLRAERHPA